MAKRCRRRGPGTGEGRSLDPGGSPKRGSKLCPQGLGEETKVGGGQCWKRESENRILERGSGGQGGDLTPALVRPTSPGAGPSPGLVLRKRQLQPPLRPARETTDTKRGELEEGRRGRGTAGRRRRRLRRPRG